MGLKLSEEAKLKVSLSKRFEKNYNWKGEDATYSPKHKWVYKMMGKAKVCSNCGSKKFVEWANISGEYRRVVSDWEQLCRKCHMIKDGRLENIKKYSFVPGWEK